MSFTITVTSESGPTFFCPPSLNSNVRSLFRQLQGYEEASLLDKFEAQAVTNLPLALAHIYFRVLKKSDEALCTQVLQLLKEALKNESAEAFLSAYPQKWACQILQNLHQMGKNSDLISHFSKKLEQISLDTDDGKEDFSLILCCILFEMEEEQQELSALLAVVVPAGETPLEFAQRYHQARYEHKLVLQDESLKLRVDIASKKALSALKQATPCALSSCEEFSEEQKVTTKKIKDQINKKQTLLSQIAQELLDL